MCVIFFGRKKKYSSATSIILLDANNYGINESQIEGKRKKKIK